MKSRIFYILIVSVLFTNICKGQIFGNFKNIEDLFKLSKSEVENKITNDNGYILKSKDIKSGIMTYSKKIPYYSFTINVLFKGNQLKTISWDDTIMNSKFIVEDIGSDNSYKIDEAKTNDNLGVFVSVSKEKGFQISIFKTQPNIQKRMISFSLTKVKK